MDPTKWGAPFPVVAAALFGIVLLRAGGTYLLGRLAAGAAHRMPRVRDLMDRPGYQLAVARLNRWGAPAVSLSFLTIGVQTLVNLAAGATRMPLVRYLPAAALGSIAWALVYATAGVIGVEAVIQLYELHPAAAVLGLLAGVTALAAWLALQFRRRTQGATED